MNYEEEILSHSIQEELAKRYKEFVRELTKNSDNNTSAHLKEINENIDILSKIHGINEDTIEWMKSKFMEISNNNSSVENSYNITEYKEETSRILEFLRKSGNN
ncbi:MAG: hypothetical protein ACOCUR_01510 [Nanoarchaeota archaeon]